MTFYDLFGNAAILDEIKILPYNGTLERSTAHRLRCYANYDGGRLYFLSLYATEREALAKLDGFSCGTFKAVESDVIGN